MCGKNKYLRFARRINIQRIKTLYLDSHVWLHRSSMNNGQKFQAWVAD